MFRRRTTSRPAPSPVGLESLEPRLLLAVVSAQWADRFVDSMGIMNQSGHWSSTYAPWEEVVPIIQDIGFRHVRGVKGLHMDDFPASSKMKVVVAPTFSYVGSVLDTSAAAVAKGLKNLKSQYNREEIDAIEASNELNNSTNDPNWGTTLRNYQIELYNQVRADPWFDGIPVLGPSLNYTKFNYAQLGDLTDYVDAGNLHAYGYDSGWKSAGFSLDRERGWMQLATTTQPLWVTETGYGSDVFPSYTPVARYFSRLYLGGFNRGFQRVYGHELLNNGTPRNSASPWGIVTPGAGAAYTLEAPAVTVKNMIALLSDAGAEFQGGALDFNLTGTNADTRTTLLQKRDGRFYLAIWQEVTNNADADVAALNVTVTFTDPVTGVTRYVPQNGTAGTTLTLSGNAVTTAVTDRVTILEISRTQAAAPAAPTLSVNVRNSTRADLTWSNVPGENGYRVERRDGSKTAEWRSVYVAPKDTTSWSEINLTPNHEYAYRVIALSPSGGSTSASQVVSVRAPASSVTLDTLANFSQTSTSTGWQILTASSNNYVGDQNMAIRSSDTTGGLVWNRTNTENFFASVYLHSSQPTSTLKFFSSPDGTTWTQRPTFSWSSPTSGGWNVVHVRPDSTLPAGTNYIKFESTAPATQMRLGRMRITHGLGVGSYPTANRLPIANADSVTTSSAGAVTINVLENDRDLDAGNTLTISSVTQGQFGTVSVVDNKLVYTTTGAHTGLDTFTYTLSDGKGGSDIGTVTTFRPNLTSDNFSASTLNSGWTLSGPGAFTVSNDSRLRMDYFAGWADKRAIWKPTDPATLAWSNYTVSADVSAYSTTSNPALGLHFYYSNASNYYSFHMDHSIGQLVLQKVVNGTATNIKTASFSYDDDVTYNLKVSVNNGVITAFVDGVNVFGGSYADAAHNDGTIALYAKPHFAYFDNVQVYSNGQGPVLTATALTDGGFEAPALASPGAYQYRPTGTAWTYTSAAGVTRTGSGGFNSTALEGLQSAFLQTTGVISRTLTLTPGSRYAIGFYSAQRGSQRQNFQVQIDGVSLGSFQPPSSSWHSYITLPFVPTLSSVTLSFVGTNTFGGDNTAFLDEVRLLLL